MYDIDEGHETKVLQQQQPAVEGHETDIVMKQKLSALVAEALNS